MFQGQPHSAYLYRVSLRTTQTDPTLLREGLTAKGRDEAIGCINQGLALRRAQFVENAQKQSTEKAQPRQNQYSVD